jgi:nucleotide-binding universal stress UspA family protein
MSIFPTKILVATDSSEEASLAARTAVDLADKTNSELHVVHVEPVSLPLDPYTDVVRETKEIEENRRKMAQRLLDEQVERITASGGTVTQAHARLGKPDEEIILLAEEIGAGLIVMGSRGLGGLRRALMGSVSDSVVRHAHCPVLVVRKEKSVEEARPEEVGLV